MPGLQKFSERYDYWIIAPVHRETDCLKLAFAYQEARKADLARVSPLVAKG